MRFSAPFCTGELTSWFTVPIPGVEEEGRVAELLTPHFPYIPDDAAGLLPSIFDKVGGPSLKYY